MIKTNDFSCTKNKSNSLDVVVFFVFFAETKKKTKNTKCVQKNHETYDFILCNLSGRKKSTRTHDQAMNTTKGAKVLKRVAHTKRFQPFFLFLASDKSPKSQAL